MAAVPGEKKRLMWDNIAIWYKIRDFAELFAKRGCNFVAATYTNAWARKPSTSWDRDKPWESMARGLFANHPQQQPEPPFKGS